MEGVTNNRLNSTLERQQFRQLTDCNLRSDRISFARDPHILVEVIPADHSFTLVVHAS